MSHRDVPGETVCRQRTPAPRTPARKYVASASLWRRWSAAASRESPWPGKAGMLSSARQARRDDRQGVPRAPSQYSRFTKSSRPANTLRTTYSAAGASASLQGQVRGQRRGLTCVQYVAVRALCGGQRERVESRYLPFHMSRSSNRYWPALLPPARTPPVGLPGNNHVRSLPLVPPVARRPSVLVPPRQHRTPNARAHEARPAPLQPAP